MLTNYHVDRPGAAIWLIHVQPTINAHYGLGQSPTGRITIPTIAIPILSSKKAPECSCVSDIPLSKDFGFSLIGDHSLFPRVLIFKDHFPG